MSNVLVISTSLRAKKQFEYSDGTFDCRSERSRAYSGAYQSEGEKDQLLHRMSGLSENTEMCAEG